MVAQQKRIALARRPAGMPVPADFRIETVPAPRDPAPGEMLLANRILSVDPAIRGFLDDRPSYLPPVAIGATVRGMVLGEVIESRRPDFAKGDLVRALAGWEDYSLIGDALGLERVDPLPGRPLADVMGALGPAGLTAWVGLHEIAHIRAGETVVISAAAGAVGSVAGQIAQIAGARVVGIAGSDDKLARLAGIGFAAGINYRSTPDLGAALVAACPDGIDVYFDNVGGQTLETILPLMNQHGRVAVCGMIADYNDADHPYGVKTLWQLVVKRITMRGFLTYDHGDVLARAGAELRNWAADGRLVPLDTCYAGLEQAPQAFIDMLAGRTLGKTLVTLAG